MAPLLWITTALVRWFRLKVYQYEVTFAIYMLTPTEKFIFTFPLSAIAKNHCFLTDTLLLTLITMIVTGVYVYLPDHLRSIYGHLYYYWAGERPFISTGLPSISAVFRDNSTKTLEMVYDTVKDAAATATGPIAEL
ncbi:hypothetical protein GB937_002200 [Aspergillus fischeri]|nr:hypothetical protein GB937_002200 [Aspergillus fischeri]